jgi:hypothetical protein
VADHQRLTIERYDAIKRWLARAAYVLPVLQGYWPEEYVAHLRQYGDRLKAGQWVGVGSVCKRNVDVEEVEHVLMAPSRGAARPAAARVRGEAHRPAVFACAGACLRRTAWPGATPPGVNRRGGNDWRNARAFVAEIEGQKARRREFSFNLF